MHVSVTVKGFAALIVALVITACTASRDDSGPLLEDRALPAGTLDEQARALLTEMNPISFTSNREYCGFIYETGGQRRTTAVRPGTEASCLLFPPTAVDWRLVASFHTHGSHSRRYDSEVPSVQDLLSDRSAGTTGYVATPGGRFWKIDGPNGIATLLCVGCVPTDPNYNSREHRPVANRYTLDELRQRQGG